MRKIKKENAYAPAGRLTNLIYSHWLAFLAKKMGIFFTEQKCPPIKISLLSRIEFMLKYESLI